MSYTSNMAFALRFVLVAVCLGRVLPLRADGIDRESLVAVLASWEKSVVDRRVVIEVRIDRSKPTPIVLRSVVTVDDNGGLVRRVETINKNPEGAVTNRVGWFFIDKYYVRVQQDLKLDSRGTKRTEILLGGAVDIGQAETMVVESPSVSMFLGHSPIIRRDQYRVSRLRSLAQDIKDGKLSTESVNGVKVIHLASRPRRGAILHVWFAGSEPHRPLRIRAREQLQQPVHDGSGKTRSVFLEYEMSNIHFADNANGVSLPQSALITYRSNDVGLDWNTKSKLILKSIEPAPKLGEKIAFETLTVPDGRRVAIRNDPNFRYELHNGKLYKMVDTETLKGMDGVETRHRTTVSTGWWWVTPIGLVAIVVGLVFLVMRRS